MSCLPGSDCARQAEGGLKSLVPRGREYQCFAEYRGLYMHPQIAQLLYPEGILLPVSPDLCANANDKRAHCMCALLLRMCESPPLSLTH